MDQPSPSDNPPDSPGPNSPPVEEVLTSTNLAALILMQEERIKRLESEVKALHSFLEHSQVGGLYSTVRRDLYIELFERAGLESVEGQPIREWFFEATKSHMETMMIALEDKDPEAAASFQAMLDRIIPEKE